MEKILKWQYDQLIKALLLLQEHQADTSCPCESGGEMCVHKHLMEIEAYAQETLPMENNKEYRKKLGKTPGYLNWRVAPQASLPSTYFYVCLIPAVYHLQVTPPAGGAFAHSTTACSKWRFSTSHI
jgi:hypothetical protein